MIKGRLECVGWAGGAVCPLALVISDFLGHHEAWILPQLSWG